MNSLIKQKETLRKQTYGCRGVGKVRGFGMDMYTLLYLKQISNKDLLYSTGNSAQCYVPAWMGMGFGGESVSQFSHSDMSDSLQPHGLQHARLPCQSPTPGACSKSCPSSRWCHPAISSSAIPFSCSQSFLASGSFLSSQLFTSGGQSIGVSALTSELPMNIQDWFPLGWTGWISLQSKWLSRIVSNTTIQVHQFFGTQLSL